MAFHYDPQDIEGVKHHTEELCGKLRELGQKLRNGSLAPADAKADFDAMYQPDALALADAMTKRLPGNSRHIAIESRDNDMRYVKLWDRPSIAWPLQEYDAHTAGVQLQTIAGILRTLSSSLEA